MTNVVDPRCQAARVQLNAADRAEARQIAIELAAIARSGLVLPGTIQERLTRCGRANCACQSDPPKRHGPYFQWTRKVAQKTVGKWLSPEQRSDYQEWVDNDRRLHELVTRLEALGISALDADTRTRQRN